MDTVRRVSCPVLGILAAGLAACGSGERPAFSPPVEGTVLTVKEFKPDGSAGESRPMQFVGETVVRGVKVDRLQVGHFDRAEPDGEEWFIAIDHDTLTFAGGEVWYPSSTTPGIPGVTAIADPPLVIDLDPPVGVPQTASVKGQVLLGNPASPDMTVDVDETLTYTLVSASETVSTAMGDMAGARHYAASATLLDLPATADVWLVDGVGIVKATYSWEGATGPAGFSLESVLAAEAVKKGYATMRKEVLLGPGNTEFRLSTTERAGQVDVDKNVHAKQFLEVRWADDARARTSEQPPVDFLFLSGAFGYFPAFLVESETSLFHTHEAGAGYHYWIAAVDEASKNDNFQPTAYAISVRYQPSTANETGAVRVSASIHYKVYTP